MNHLTTVIWPDGGLAVLLLVNVLIVTGDADVVAAVTGEDAVAARTEMLLMRSEESAEVVLVTGTDLDAAGAVTGSVADAAGAVTVEGAVQETAVTKLSVKWRRNLAAARRTTSWEVWEKVCTMARSP